MKKNLWVLVLGVFFIIMILAFTPIKNRFTAAEQQQIFIETPGLFARSDAFSIDFGELTKGEYSFPLPDGKATLQKNNSLAIASKHGDIVRAMFDGMVRLVRNHKEYGNVIVIRHDNGLETVYANNDRNLVKVGERVKAGQGVAIIGTKNGETCCNFSIMVNGCRINPETLLSIRNHSLRKKTLLCTKNGTRVNIRTTGRKEKEDEGKKEKVEDKKGKVEDKKGKEKVKKEKEKEASPKDFFERSNTYSWNLEKVKDKDWAYPLPNAHVISPYGDHRNHAGVDLKTKPNDKIVAAFSGVVTRSSRFSGYGNCIIIKHDNGFETLYSHQSKNLVKVGEKVKVGQVIGLTGRTGHATTEHLHFETHFMGRRFNPSIMFDHANHCLRKVTLVLTKSGKITSKKNK